MTRRPQEKKQDQVQDDVQAMLARATPKQLRRLLDDIAAAPVREAVKYDA